MGLETLAEVMEVAILAEKYMMEHLRNQTSDILRSQLHSGTWKLVRAIVERLYEAVPGRCILRRLCAVDWAAKLMKIMGIIQLRRRGNSHRMEDGP